MSLFNSGDFTLASGRKSKWLIDASMFDSEDWSTIAKQLVDILPPFGAVEGVPQGGLPLALYMQQYVTEGKLLIVDDVWTTGYSWRVHAAGRDAIGAVVFARGGYPAYITPLWTLASALMPAETRYPTCVVHKEEDCVFPGDLGIEHLHPIRIIGAADE